MAVDTVDCPTLGMVLSRNDICLGRRVAHGQSRCTCRRRSLYLHYGKEMCCQVTNRAYQLGRSQAGKYDLPAVQTCRDDVLAEEVVPSEPHPSDLEPGQILTELSYQNTYTIVDINVLTLTPHETHQ